MSAPLPAWCQSPEARALLGQIIAERPDHALVKRDAWTNQFSPVFKGDAARALRTIWKQACEEALDAHGRDAWLEVVDAHPDDLIESALETPTLLDLMVEDMGQGLHRVAA